MRLELGRHVGIAREIGAVGEAFLEQHMHDGAGERAVGAGPRHQMDVRHLRRAGAIGIDHHQRRAALLAGPADVGHHIDLGRDGIAAPDDDQIGLGDLAGIDAALDADPGEPAGIRQRHADGRELPRIAHGMAQPLDPVALHQPHGAGIEIGPDRLAAMAGRGALEGLGHLVQRRLPGDRLEGPDPLALSARRGAADGPGDRGDAGARHSGRPWRRPPPRYSCSRPRPGPCRCASATGARPRARRCSGSHAGRRKGRCRGACFGVPGGRKV